MSQSVYFASDAHFGAGTAASQAERVRRFTRWLDTLDDAEHLYLVGDVFDFWLDYPTYMPKVHMEVLYGLRRLQDRGVGMTFVGGNHDAWCESFFEDTLGVPALPSGAVVEHQGLRLMLHHGDGLLASERSYAVFKAVTRHPVPVFLAKLIHPEALYAFAMWLSRRSRARDRDDAADIVGMIDDYGRTHDHSDVDHVVIGHVHTPVRRDFDGWSLTCLGDWSGHFTAGRLHDGRLELVRIDAEGAMHPLGDHPTTVGG
jgi:UDP-2,3-diacylglucosamine hydrolase